MTETFSAIFQKSGGAPIERDGVIIRPSLRLGLNKGIHDFVLRRLQVKSTPLQGIRLKVKKGDVSINGQKLQDVVLWANNSPEVVEFSVVSKGDCELLVWNTWEIDGLVQARVGNAGVVVEQRNEHQTMLSCSDGTGVIDFSCIVVQIEQRL